MAKTKIPMQRRLPKTPDRLPALNPARLQLTLQAIEALPIPAEAKRAVAESLKAAANPNAERADVVIQTLDEDEQRSIATAARDYQRTMGRVAQRGQQGLMALSDGEWDQLMTDSEVSNDQTT